MRSDTEDPNDWPAGPDCLVRTAGFLDRLDRRRTG
jgi:hypothetical protein